MLSLPLGPLSLPVAPLLLLAAAWAASRLAARLTPPAELKPAAADGVWHALLAGLAGARLGHLALNAQAYAAQPWAAVDIRDGGWHLASGLVAAAAWLAWRLRRPTELRRPLAFAAGAGLAVWTAAQVLVDQLQPQLLPALPLVALDDGRGADLARLGDGRPMVVNLWATWCGPCRVEMPVLAAAQQRESGHPQPVRIVFVNQGERAGQVRAYLRAQGLTIGDVWLDEAARAGPALGSRGLPTTLFFDAEGRRVGAHLGVLNAAALQGRLRALRAPP